MDQPLSGISVLDLTWHVAGPFATRLLAAYGADVIKIERPGTGDPARRAGPFPGDVPHPERSGRFLYLNTGKQSVTLNLKSRAGRDLLLDLARTVDIVVENFAPRVLPGLGLDWPALQAANPALVLVSIANFGQTGPKRDDPATNLTLFAAGGQMSLTGEADREPLVNGGTQPLMQAGLHGFSAALTALYGARAHGHGTHVDISIQEVQAASLEGGGPAALVYGLDMQRSGNMLNALWGIYSCADGYVGCNCLERNVPNLLAAIERPDLLQAGFLDAQWRAEHDDEIVAIMTGFFLEHTRAELLDLAIRKRVPFGIVPTMEELFSWPSLQEKGFWQEIDHPDAGPQIYPGAPFTIEGDGFQLHRAPRLGEHTDAVLQTRLGLDPAVIGELRARGIV